MRPNAQQKSPKRSPAGQVARRIDRRALGRLRKLALATVGIVGISVLSLRVHDYLLHSQSLAVSLVTFSGTLRTSPNLLAMVSESLRGANIFTVDLGQIEATLTTNEPWIRSATLRRILPNRIEIEVTEHTAVARLDLPAQLVTGDGLLLSAEPAQAGDELLPRLRSAALPSIEDTRRSVDLLSVLEYGREPLSVRLDHVEIRNRDLIVRLVGNSYDIHLGNADFAGRLNRFRNVEPLLRTRYSGLRTVDLRFPDRIVVAPVSDPSQMSGS